MIVLLRDHSDTSADSRVLDNISIDFLNADSNTNASTKDIPNLNDSFTMDGIISVSARDIILREVVSNLLAHRDFSSAYVAKFIIEKDRIPTENSNRSHGLGSLDIESFEPFPKNPPISKVFREIGLADELGSGKGESTACTTYIWIIHRCVCVSRRQTANSMSFLNAKGYTIFMESSIILLR